MSTNTDQEKRTAVNTATINFAKSVRDNAISKVIDVIKTAGSSTAATEPEETEVTHVNSIQLDYPAVTLQRGSTLTVTATVTVTGYGTDWTITLINEPSWCSILGRTITIQPPSDESAGIYYVIVRARGTDGSSADAELEITVIALAPTPT